MTPNAAHFAPCPACLADLFTPGWTVAALLRFHTVHKLVLMAHSPEAYRALGQLAAGAHSLPRTDVERRYTSAFNDAVAIAVTPGRHVNVLQHAAGYFKNRLGRAGRDELQDAIEDYRCGRVALTVPITLIARLVRALEVEYLAGQVYLDLPS